MLRDGTGPVFDLSIAGPTRTVSPDKSRTSVQDADMRKRPFLYFAAVLWALCPSLFAFNGHVVQEGPLTLSIADVPVITAYEEPQRFLVSVTNRGTASLEVTLSLTHLVDNTRSVGASTQVVTVPAQSSRETAFQFAMGRPSYSALYPLHIQAVFEEEGQKREARAIRVFETRFPETTAVPASPWRVPSGGALALSKVMPSSAGYQLKGGEFTSLPSGWQGDHQPSGSHFARQPATRGGETRSAIQIHPPWRGAAGALYLDYKVQLPPTLPLRFTFCNAIRDHLASEPPSDGITFRVSVAGETLFERHTDSKTWAEGAVDLSRFAGQEIVLRLESHPGPRFNTTCDSGFWGDPVITSGPAGVQISAQEQEKLRTIAREFIRKGRATEAGYLYKLDGELWAALVPGPNGIADAALGFGRGDQAVAFTGIKVSLWDRPLGGAPGGLPVHKLQTDQDASGRTRLLHHIVGPDGPSTVQAEIWRSGPGLRVRISSPGRITDLALRSADSEASRVYYGHGYCIEKPAAFRAGGGGHNLSTSHVGFDFPNGVSLLTACDTPPDFFQVDPATKVYALHTHPDSTFTFVPSLAGALDSAIKYQPLYDKKPAPALQQKAGRFVFDIWGGRYAEDARLLERCFAYGLTNSLAIMHVWQRWGYDYRLPDIYPPQPNLGSEEELRQLGDLCRRHGALWGLHDNYIDIYPDATGFSYEAVTFDTEGRPRKAWFNEGRTAQSYQFRPDKVQPFLDRNLKLIGPALAPTTSFVDVWTSINAFDYHDHLGQFHSKTETLRAWGEGFASIRRAFGDAPTTSEAGADQLIGWLEGADCQFLRLSAQPQRFNNHVPCGDWERVPWFDAVNHARFSLHGAGYSDRYQGVLPRDLYGIESDDYIGTEILTAHALMIDLPGMPRGAVRKYWLAQDFIESVALDDIARVEFFEGDLHRLEVRWKNGARVLVNRSTNDWTIGKRVLPPFGYLAQGRGLESSIEKLAGISVEQSRKGAVRYVNGRGFVKDAPLRIQPKAAGFEAAGEGKFKLLVEWDAQAPAPKDFHVFYHFAKEVPGRYSKLEFAGGGIPSLPTSRWSGKILTGTNWVMQLPTDYPDGEYEVLVGLWDAAESRRRARLTGKEVPERRYRIGRLQVSKDAEGNRSVQFLPTEEPATLTILANQVPVDFGGIKTIGGLRITQDQAGLTLLPLPDGDAFDIELEPKRLGMRTPLREIVAVSPTGEELRKVSFQAQNGKTRFRTNPADFGYRLR